MKKIIPTFAIFMSFSVAAMADNCDQLSAGKTVMEEQTTTHATCDKSAVRSTRFAGLGGLFGNQRVNEAPVTYRHNASRARFVNLGGLFGHQDASAVAINFHQMNVATGSRFSGLGGLFSGQQTTKISRDPVLESVL